MHTTIDLLQAEIEDLKQKLQQANAEKQQCKDLFQAYSHGEMIHLKSQLLTLINGFHYAILLEDEQRKIVVANQWFCELFSIPVAPEQLVGMDCSQSAEQVKDLFVDGNFVSTIDTILREKKPVFSQELSMVDGRFLLRDYIPVKDEKDNYLGHYWVYQDVTERKKSEILMQQVNIQLDKQKEFYESILNSIPSDIAAFGDQHEYLFVNPVGIANPELRKWIIGKTDYDYCKLKNKPIELADSRRRSFEKIKATGQQLVWEEKLVNKDGSASYYLRHLYPVFNSDGSMKMALGYGVNITERKHIEDELKKSEELYRLVIEATNDGIWDWDMLSNEVFFNKRLKQMLGYEEMEFEHHLSTWHKIMHPDDLVEAEKILKDHLEKDLPFFYKLRFFHKDGSIRWIMCRGFAMRNEDGLHYRMLGSYTDVTDIMETKEALRIAKENAEETSKAKEMFLANMSHEIRTPLNGIIGLAQLLNKTILNTVQSEYLKAIRYSADNLLVIINDILDLAKIEAGKMDLEYIDFDVNEIAENVIKSFTYKAEEKGIQLFACLPENRIVLLGDPYRLTQILTNLLGNAIKFTQNGNVELCIVQQSDDVYTHLTFHVKDTGIGMHESKMETIFNSFSQAQSDTARKYGGTGLGLAICKKLIELQNGSIGVKSQLGKGSEFTFDLKYDKGNQQSDRIMNQKIQEFAPLENVRILLAEDNEINQFLAGELLKSWGIEFDIVANGIEAIVKWTNHDYDLILMDVQMPILGGLEATLEIRRGEQPKASIPIIALTANAMSSQKDRVMSVGMNDFVSKPFKEVELYQKIVNLLPEHRKKASTQTGIVSKFYDFEKLSHISNGNKEFEKKLLRIFIDTVPDTIARLEQFCREENKDGIATTAHKLKTTINSMGIEGLKDSIQLLEDAAYAKEEIIYLKKLAKEIMDVLNQIVKDFKAILA